jgi:ribosomal protein S16
LTDPAKVELNRERIAYWTKNGAQVSETVGRLIKNNPEPASAPASAPAA